MSAHWAPAPWRNRPVVRTSSAPTHPHTNAPGHHCATIPPRTCVTAPPWCAAHAHCTLSAHPAPASAALAAAPQARPPNAHSRPQTNATDKRITQAPQPGACPWPGLPHAGLPHAGPPPPPRQWSAPPARTCAWTHGSARGAPSRPRAMRTQPPPALHRPVQPFIARDGTCARHSARWASIRSACPWDRPAAPPVGHRPADQLARASGPGLCWGLWVLWPWGVPPATGIAPPRLFWRQPGPQNAKDRNILLLGYFYLTLKD